MTPFTVDRKLTPKLTELLSPVFAVVPGTVVPHNVHGQLKPPGIGVLLGVFVIVGVCVDVGVALPVGVGVGVIVGVTVTLELTVTLIDAGVVPILPESSIARLRIVVEPVTDGVQLYVQFS